MNKIQEKLHDYEGFVEKFKPKKTTDDCYTPPAVYEAVKEWVLKEYGISSNTRVIRPFYPGGDYENEDYSGDCIVIDNPPFSILSKIIRFYSNNNVRYFLFAPHLTVFNNIKEEYKNTAIITNAHLIYENGANVNTSFTTNLSPDIAVRTAPALKKAIELAHKKERKEEREKKKLPKYNYPEEVVHIGRISKLCRAEIEIKYSERERIASLEDQRKRAGKAIFGSGMLVSRAVASRLREAEAREAEAREAEAREAEAREAYNWQLSDAERAIIDRLSN